MEKEPADRECEAPCPSQEPKNKPGPKPGIKKRKLSIGARQPRKSKPKVKKKVVKIQLAWCEHEALETLREERR